MTTNTSRDDKKPSLKIRYFASLREQAQRDAEEIYELFETPEKLYLALRQRYDFSLDLDQLRVAINGQFSQMHHSLAAGDEIVFIPPVSGG